MRIQNWPQFWIDRPTISRNYFTFIYNTFVLFHPNVLQLNRISAIFLIIAGMTDKLNFMDVYTQTIILSRIFFAHRCRRNRHSNCEFWHSTKWHIYLIHSVTLTNNTHFSLNQTEYVHWVIPFRPIYTHTHAHYIQLFDVFTI